VNAGPKELNESFVRSLPDNGPAVMVNLLRFKEESADGDGSGWDAYLLENGHLSGIRAGQLSSRKRRG
jgi:hypothetical protein